jgi:solute:Na+ symporter, SSS family
VFLSVWGQLQFTGLIAALHGLGWTFPPVVLVLISAALAFVYIAISGVRSTAAIAVLKDVIMILAIIVTGVAVLWKFDVRHVFETASAHVRNTMNPEELRFSMSTIFFQSLGFICVPMLTQFLFTAKSDQTIRRAQIAMPLYMFMYPFLVLASYYALSANLHLASPNDAFLAAAVQLLPGWLLGTVAAGAALSGLLVLAGLCLALGPLVSRNLMPHTPEARQKNVARLVVAIYLAASMVLTLATPNLMLVLINTAYFGFTQFFPGLIAVLFLRNLNPVALGLGILAGQSAAIYANYAGLHFGGVNVGLVCLGLNVAIALVGSLAFRVKQGTQPIFHQAIQ